MLAALVCAHSHTLLPGCCILSLPSPAPRFSRVFSHVVQQGRRQMCNWQEIHSKRKLNIIAASCSEKNESQRYFVKHLACPIFAEIGFHNKLGSVVLFPSPWELRVLIHWGLAGVCLSCLWLVPVDVNASLPGLTRPKGALGSKPCGLEHPKGHSPSLHHCGLSPPWVWDEDGFWPPSC